MQKVDSINSYELYDSMNELPLEWRNLMLDARKATQTAYVPYSDFHVGAAVLLENGTTVTGSNQENAAYPSGLCAERVAVFAASAHHPGVKFKAIAVAAFAGKNTSPVAVSPCGSCRQVMTEYEHLFGNDIRFIMQGEGEKIIVLKNVKSLLPFTFTAEQLGDSNK